LKRPAAIVACVAVLCTLSACAAQPQSAPTALPGRPTAVATSQADADQFLAECLRAKGWVVTVDPNGGGVEADFPRAQYNRYSADNTTCSNQIGYRKWTAADYRIELAGLVKANRCLVAAHYPTPSSVPSLQTFTEQRAGSSSVTIWDPYSLISPDKLRGALTACPQPTPIY
jgi:hypothetical protein